jgi:uncharacterized protein YuzE
MSDTPLIPSSTVTYHYDSYQDALYIHFRPIEEFTHYAESETMPGILLRYDIEDELVGVTVENLSEIEPSALNAEKNMRVYALELVTALVERI